MARNATEVRVNEINILLKKLAERRSAVSSTVDGYSRIGVGLSEAIRVLGERKREIRRLKAEGR